MFILTISPPPLPTFLKLNLHPSSPLQPLQNPCYLVKNMKLEVLYILVLTPPISYVVWESYQIEVYCHSREKDEVRILLLFQSLYSVLSYISSNLPLPPIIFIIIGQDRIGQNVPLWFALFVSLSPYSIIIRYPPTPFYLLTFIRW